jgi:predicted nucleotidyltransferase
VQTWRSFKAQRGNGRFQTAFQAIDAAIKRLLARRNANIMSVILFGSLARRRPTYDDIDMLIITKPGSGSMSEVTRRFAVEVFGPLFLEYRELFSFIVYTQDQLAQLRDTLPLLDEIRREGVLIYGQDPFTQTAGAGVSSDRSPSTGNG